MYKIDFGRFMCNANRQKVNTRCLLATIADSDPANLGNHAF